VEIKSPQTVSIRKHCCPKRFRVEMWTHPNKGFWTDLAVFSF